MFEFFFRYTRGDNAFLPVHRRWWVIAAGGCLSRGEGGGKEQEISVLIRNIYVD